MADLAVTRDGTSEPKEVIEEERVDEGRWDSEGGPPLPQKPLPHQHAAKSPDIEDESKASSAKFDQSKGNPRALKPTVEGKISESKYPVESVTNEHAAESHSQQGKQEGGRRKSIGDKMAAGWQEFKNKAEEFVNSHRKSSASDASKPPSSTETK